MDIVFLYENEFSSTAQVVGDNKNMNAWRFGFWRATYHTAFRAREGKERGDEYDGEVADDEVADDEVADDEFADDGDDDADADADDDSEDNEVADDDDADKEVAGDGGADGTAYAATAPVSRRDSTTSSVQSDAGAEFSDVAEPDPSFGLGVPVRVGVHSADEDMPEEDDGVALSLAPE